MEVYKFEGKGGVGMAMYNVDESIEDFAHLFQIRSLKRITTLYDNQKYNSQKV